MINDDQKNGRVCTVCNEHKSRDQFSVRTDNGRLKSWCKKCFYENKNTWRKRNPVKTKTQWERARGNKKMKLAAMIALRASTEKTDLFGLIKYIETFKKLKSRLNRNKKSLENYYKHHDQSKEIARQKSKIRYHANKQHYEIVSKRNVLELTDSYVRAKLGMSAENCPASLIELKRAQLKLHRAIKETQKHERKSA